MPEMTSGSFAGGGAPPKSWSLPTSRWTLDAAGIVDGINSIPDPSSSSSRCFLNVTSCCEKEWGAALFQVAASHSKEFHLPGSDSYLICKYERAMLCIHIIVWYCLHIDLHITYNKTCSRLCVYSDIRAHECMSHRQSSYCPSSWFQGNADCGITSLDENGH